MITTTESPEKINVWLHSFCPQVLSPEDLGLHFQNTFIRAQPYHPNNGRGPGIIVASEITPQICDFIRAVSEDNNERILVLITEGASLGNSNPWQILHAGASDVLLWDQTQILHRS
jgi:hypothetical protein